MKSDLYLAVTSQLYPLIVDIAVNGDHERKYQTLFVNSKNIVLDLSLFANLDARKKVTHDLAARVRNCVTLFCRDAVLDYRFDDLRGKATISIDPRLCRLGEKNRTLRIDCRTYPATMFGIREYVSVPIDTANL